MMRILSRHRDFILAIAVGAAVFKIAPWRLPTSFLGEMYSGGIAVLAVVFSVVFAAITLLASIGDDAFLHFLEEDGALTTLLNSFTTTLNILFGALVLSIIEFGFAEYALAKGWVDQLLWGFVVYCFALSYALVSSRLVGNDIIRFAKLRAAFIRQTNSGVDR